MLNHSNQRHTDQYNYLTLLINCYIIKTIIKIDHIMKFQQILDYSLRLSLLATAAASLYFTGQFDFLVAYMSIDSIVMILDRSQDFEWPSLLLPYLAVACALLAPHAIQSVLFNKLLLQLTGLVPDFLLSYHRL